MVGQPERRGAKCSECDIEAKIELSDGLAIACRIKCLSPSGFRLLVVETIYLPEEFDLLLPMIPGADQRCRARVVWRKADELGGEFLAPIAQ